MNRWIATSAALACAVSLQAQTTMPRASASPMYMNAEVVRADVSGRTLTFRGTGGATKLAAEGDAVASLSGLKAGDQVILAYADAPSGRRITGIRPTTPSRAASLPVLAVAAVPVVQAAVPVSAATFEGSASVVAVRAGQVDRAWTTYRGFCVKGTDRVNARGREWFALLDGSMPRPTDDGCGTRYDEVAAVAKDFETQLDKLRANAAEAGVLPGALRETLQRYNIDL